MKNEIYKELKRFSSDELLNAIIKLGLDTTLLKELLILTRKERYFTLQYGADEFSELSYKALSKDIDLHIKYSTEAQRLRRVAFEYYKSCILKESI